MKLPLKEYRASNDACDDLAREEQATSLLKTFFIITKEWGLRTQDERALLGFPDAWCFHGLRNGLQPAISSLSEDGMDRLAFITGIYNGLRILFTQDNMLNWLHNHGVEFDPSMRPWGEGAPLPHMLSGKIEKLIDVYRYVNGLLQVAITDQ
ncbi:MAG: hypothetical protein ACYDC8_17480 [Gammaproteobacteria bacterium]